MFALSHTLALFVQHERMWVKLDCVGRGHRHANNQIINLLENSAAGESKHIDLMSPIGWRATRLSVCHQNDSIVDSMTREAMLLCQHICEANARSRKKKTAKLLSDLRPKMVECVRVPGNDLAKEMATGAIKSSLIDCCVPNVSI